MAWPIRYNIVGLLTLGTMVNYIDRVNISVAAPEIMRQTGWDEAQFGIIFSVFLVGYTLLQYPGGAIADRWSARKMLGLSCIGFSLFTALTPWDKMRSCFCCCYASWSGAVSLSACRLSRHSMRAGFPAQNLVGHKR